MTPAETLARRLHATQLDRAGQPYVAHLERVVGHLLRRWPDASEDEVAAAWLHDAMEDQGATWRDVESATNADVAALVVNLSRGPDMSYALWIGIMAIAHSRSTIRIKLADLADNMDPARVAAAGTERLVAERYAPAKARLERALVERGIG